MVGRNVQLYEKTILCSHIREVKEICLTIVVHINILLYCLGNNFDTTIKFSYYQFDVNDWKIQI